MIRRAILFNGLIFIGVGIVLLVAVFLDFADIPLIITALLTVGVAAPLQFNKAIESHGVVEAVYGPKYWIKFGIAMLLAIIGALFIAARFPLSDIGVFVTAMALAAVVMAFVNPTYVLNNLPAKR